MLDLEEHPVRFELIDGVAVITLDRPAVLNAINAALAGAFAEAVARAEKTAEARAILLRGAGRAFCAGGDVSTFQGDPVRTVERTISRFHPAIERLACSPLPTVAAVHGAVAGAGLSLMLACDFAIATADARFTLAYPKIGATIDGGASWFLPRLVGVRKAKELALLAERFDADTALAQGLVNRVVPAADFEIETMTFARALASGPTKAYATIKRLIDASLSTDLAGQLDAEKKGFIDIASTSDFAEGFSAFLEKRPPSFSGK